VPYNLSSLPRISPELGRLALPIGFPNECRVEYCQSCAHKEIALQMVPAQIRIPASPCDEINLFMVSPKSVAQRFVRQQLLGRLITKPLAIGN
jgi:hypothetical protein